MNLITNIYDYGKTNYYFLHKYIALLEIFNCLSKKF